MVGDSHTDIEREHGRLDGLLNAAGIAALGTVEDTDYATWKKIMAVNLDGTFLGCKHALPLLKKAGGSIVNLSSVAGLIGGHNFAAYNASKGGVRLLTKSAAIHCARAGYRIRINSVHPGYVGTALVQDALVHLPEDFADKTLERIPMQRFGDVEEIAATVVFLASDESSYMTGSELVVDGGLIA